MSRTCIMLILFDI